MLPDIKLKEFYLRYIYNADRDVEKYKELLTAIGQTKEELYNSLANFEPLEPSFFFPKQNFLQKPVY